ncbi:serine protein kinase RIO [Sulfurisphaera javensis]|uniref:non-specific serine/threonine protein kinase n=1 Tax=Sulfurisphaera javensis TaxID=2049879 RepID=A0AAT9GRT4_9CREN
MERKGKKEEKRRKDEDLFKVVDSTLDTRTYYLLFQLSRRLKLKNIYGSISAGKEAKVYPAVTEDGKWYALKIYYVSTAQSKRALEKYTFGDPRFEDIKVNNTKQLISVWARKEFKNLNRLYKNDVRVPEPIYVLENILVMQFIGENGVRAPLLKELLDEEINENLYTDIIDQIEKMVNKAELVHGDLSEYNIMVWEDKCYIIDVSQAIDINHPNALELVKRDIDNINAFFESKGIQVIETEEILRRLKIYQNEDQN